LDSYTYNNLDIPVHKTGESEIILECTYRKVVRGVLNG